MFKLDPEPIESSLTFWTSFAVNSSATLFCTKRRLALRLVNNESQSGLVAVLTTHMSDLCI